MTLHTQNRQKSAWAAEAGAEQETLAPANQGVQASSHATHNDEQAARAVMHPDYHDPDWRYYFGAMAVAH